MSSKEIEKFSDLKKLQLRVGVRINPTFVSFHIRASRVCGRIGFDSGCELGLNPVLLWVVRVRVRQPDLVRGFVRGVRVRIGQPDLTSGFEGVEF